ncbi:protein arginine N-methyltransferase 7-like [Oscarella lobularis]|uniref:protein arginine N-methyltransferase 7-like n=1 Tax=Oscarella lobularis TaxID=121494 RepID=UPI00331318C4
MFCQRINPVTGLVEWIREDDNAADDYDDKIARSQYGDMLHDADRNRKYSEAIYSAIQEFRREFAERPCHVLDIGTGSGILAMMAAKCGADRITACEVYEPLVNIAKEVIEKNQLKSNDIKVIPKRSTQIEIGRDMESKANLLVTEIFDTELIGEGVIPTIKHALENLLEPKSLIVPHSAQVFVQLLECPALYDWHELNPKQINKQYGIEIPLKMKQCCGIPSVHDVHVSELKCKRLSEPISSFHFNFTNASELKLTNSRSSSFSASQSGVAHALVMWWTLHLDSANTIRISTEPDWIDKGKIKPWRDHWMQGVFYLPQPLVINKDDVLSLRSVHDEYSIWFSVVEDQSLPLEIERPLCVCGAHLVWGRSRFAMLNDSGFCEKFATVLKKVVSTGARSCAAVGDASLLPFMANSLGIEKTLYCEYHRGISQVVSQLRDFNKRSESSIRLVSKPPTSLTNEDIEDAEQFDVYLAEPYLSSAALPWHNLYFWYARQHLSRWLKSRCTVIPMKAVLVAMAVQFRDLWKIKRPVGCVEGFDLTSFDKYTKSDHDDFHQLEPDAYHLWEYPGWALSKPIPLLEFDVSNPTQSKTSVVSIPIKRAGTCHAFVLWMDYFLDADTVLSTGLAEDPKAREELVWEKHWKQAVLFLKAFIDVKERENADPNLPLHTVDLRAKFHSESGAIVFKF